MVNSAPLVSSTGPEANDPEPDLGALQVDEHGDPALGLVGRPADPEVDLLVVGVLAVREVQAGDVHAGLDEGADLRLAGHGWPQGADDLGAAHPPSLGLRGVRGACGSAVVGPVPSGRSDPVDELTAEGLEVVGLAAA